MFDQLALGTAQFGMPYGISNKHGQVPPSEALTVLRTAQNNNITMLDTAMVYGNSEQVIGRCQKSLNKPFQIVTKISAEKLTLEEIEQLILSSIQKLGCKKLYAILIHDAKELLNANHNEVFNKLNALKSQGYCEKIGVSLYHPKDYLTIRQHHSLDLVQVPMNILDQRFNDHFIRSLFEQDDIEVHCRSLFLQGLLLIPLTELPDHFSPFSTQLRQLSNYCAAEKVTPLQACLAFAKSQTWVSKFVIGVTQNEELAEIMLNYKHVNANSFATFSCNEERLINPSLWSND